MGGAGAVGGELSRGIGVVAEGHRDRRQAHQRPISRAHPTDRLAVGLASDLELLQGGAGLVANIETPARAAEVPVAIPADEPGQLVAGIVGLGLGQARCDAQRHRRVIGPLPGRQLEHPAAHHVGDGREGVAGLKLDSGPQGITHRQSQETAQKSVTPRVADRHDLTLGDPQVMATASHASRSHPRRSHRLPHSKRLRMWRSRRLHAMPRRPREQQIRR